MAAHTNKGHSMQTLFSPQPGSQGKKPSQDAKHDATGGIFCDALLNSRQTESAGLAQGFRRKTEGMLITRVSESSTSFPETTGTHHA